ncbi:MAG: MFS transporter [Clostridiales bacterium]|nr:MFS transporter [Clostridiales bacterium]
MIRDLWNTAKGILTDVKVHWKRPAKGNYVSYKEILNLGIGGMGQQILILFISCMGLGAGNTLLGGTLGLKPLHLQYMAMIQTVLGLLFTVIRGVIVDNTRTKIGRFRPYIAIMGFPVFILITVFMFLPFETMSYNEKLMCTFAFAVALSMISPLLTDTYTELTTVITPNSAERAKVMSINSILYSLAPTVYSIVLPLMADKLGGYTNINTYRYAYVPFAFAGLVLNMFTAFGCKERIVTSKDYKPKVNVIQGVREIWRNKHWWIRNIAGYIGFLESACTVLFSWIYIYGTQDMTTYAILNTVLGTASGIAMAITPWLLKKLGNRRLLLLHNGLNVLFVGCMTFTYKIPILLFVFIYLNALVNALTIVYNQTMHSEVKDYQQYLSGKRMDFMFGTAGLIGTPITMLTGLVVPYVYECMGITTNYDILFDPVVRNNIFYVLCVMSILGAVLNLIPYFFYDLSREKHGYVIRVLYYRAIYDDYKNGELTIDSVSSSVPDIRKGLDFINAPMPDIPALKESLKQAKGVKASTDEEKAARKDGIKAAKKVLSEGKRLVLEKNASYILSDELVKYDTYYYRTLVKQAEMLLETPAERVPFADFGEIEKLAESLPESTKEEQKAKKAAIANARRIVKMQRDAARAYPGGVKVPDPERLKNALDMPQDTKEEIKAKKAAVKSAEKEKMKYDKIMGAYTEARELADRSKNSGKAFEEAARIYDESFEGEAEGA